MTKLPDLRGFTPSLPDIEAVEPSDFDGWSTDEVVAWLVATGQKLAQMERQTKAVQLAVGLGLYRVLVAEGEAGYAAALRPTVLSGLSERTLRRWRATAEEHYRLPPPSKRAVAQRQRQAIEASAQPALPSGQDSTTKKGRSDEGEAPQPGAVRGKVEDGPSAEGPRSSGSGERPAEPAPEQLPAQEGNGETGGTTDGSRPLARPPALTVGDAAARLLTCTEDELWSLGKPKLAELVVRLRPMIVRAVRKGEPPQQVAAKDCPHPSMNRLGRSRDVCGLCGSRIKVAAR